MRANERSKGPSLFEARLSRKIHKSRVAAQPTGFEGKKYSEIRNFKDSAIDAEFRLVLHNHIDNVYAHRFRLSLKPYSYITATFYGVFMTMINEDKINQISATP